MAILKLLDMEKDIKKACDELADWLRRYPTMNLTLIEDNYSIEHKVKIEDLRTEDSFQADERSTGMLVSMLYSYANSKEEENF